MKLKHHDIVIDEDEPFANCKLDRKKYAEILTKIIESYADGFVMAINNEWGTGKTTFVKMWQHHLNNNEFQTLYFNAWENDFESNPLIAILSELKTLTGDTNKTTFKALLKKGAKISKSIVPTLIKAAAEKFIDTEVVTEAMGKLSEGLVDIFEEEVKEYASKKQGLLDFKEELKKYLQTKKKNNKPIVFIIDELDRCRPDYAVEVLEQIKHFFSVPGIVFILSIDKEQLSNSVKGFYGSDHINGAEYLRRFIDVEYRMPAPKSIRFCNYLYAYFQFEDYFADPHRTQYDELKLDGRDFIEFSANLFDKTQLTLRQQEKIFSHARIALTQFKFNNFVFPSLFIFLIYLREFNIVFYNQIKNMELNPQELISETEKGYSKVEDSDKQKGFLYTEALLLLLYHNAYRQIHYKSSLFREDPDTKEKIFLIESSFEGDSKGELKRSIEYFDRTDFYSVQIDHLLNKIELIENIIV